MLRLTIHGVLTTMLHTALAMIKPPAFVALFLAVPLACGSSSSDDPRPGDRSDGGTDSGQVDGGTDSGQLDGGSDRPCDGTQYCEDDNTKAVCQDGVTRASPCYGKKCAAGRCGSCSSDDDCKSISYRCKCLDGTERTTLADSICGDSQGSQMWCSPRADVGSGLCAANGGPDTSFGYLGSGCVSLVDP